MTDTGPKIIETIDLIDGVKLAVFDDGGVAFSQPDWPPEKKFKALAFALSNAILDRQYLQRSIVETTTAIRSLVSIALTVQSNACEKARVAKELGRFDP